MKNLNLIKVGKTVGLVLSAAGMIITGLISSQENKSVLEKLVNERLKDFK